MATCWSIVVFFVSVLLLSRSTTTETPTPTPSPSPTSEVTSTLAPTPTPTPTSDCPVCPVCFNCILTPGVCGQKGTCGPDGRCQCHPGYSGERCTDMICPLSLISKNSTSRNLGDVCNCDSGWIGINCDVCDNDQVCKSVDESYVCDKTYFSQNQGHYSCKIGTPAFNSLLGGNAFGTFYFNKKDKLAFFQAYGVFGDEVGFKEQFYCSASECESNSSPPYPMYFDCAKATCSCYTNAFVCGNGAFINIGPILNLVKKMRVECEEDRACKLIEEVIGSLVGDVALDCDYGECARNQTFPPIIPERVVDKTVIGVSIGVVLGVLLLCSLGFAGYFYYQGILEKRTILAENLSNKEFLTMVSSRKVENILFKDLSYELNEKNTKTILSGVAGFATYGTVTAIMGSSGSGKTTTLDILAMRNKRGKVQGDIYISGKKISHSEYKRLCGYVDQEDTLFASLTVRESVLYAARLRLPSSISYLNIMRRVESILSALNISHVAERKIGSKGQRGISGGEKRRVSIACELVTTPAILFLDEPTSGLDSFSAFTVVDAVKKIAVESGMIIIMTIHQPRSDIFQMFDRLLIMGNGKMVYSGVSSLCSEYFSSIGFDCPSSFNPADYYIDIFYKIGGVIEEESDMTQNPDVEMKPLNKSLIDHQNKLIESFKSSKQYQSLISEIETLTKGEGREEGEKSGNNGLNYFQQVYILSGRTFINFYRDPMLMVTHFGTAITLGLLMGLLFFQIENDISGIQNRLGFIFFVLAIFAFASLSSLEIFSSEKQIFVSERANGYYGVLSYFTSKILFDNIPLRVIPPILLSVISYFMVGFSSEGTKFAKFLLVLILFNLTSGSFTMCFGSLIPNKSVANLLASLAMLFSLLFSGFLINKEAMPVWIGWIQYLSFMNYGFEALLVNEVQGLVIRDEVAGIVIDVSANAIISQFGFEPNSYWRDVAILAGFYLFYLLVSFLALKFLVRERR